MTTLDVFQYAGQQIRTVIVDGEPWFVAADVCTVLDVANVTQALTRLDDDERTLISNEGRQTNAVNEPGLYSLILGSRKPDAKVFKRWVTHEVLPQIRRTGQFRQTEPEHALPQTYADALRELAASVERVEALETERAANAPKVVAYAQLMDAEGLYTMEEAAKIGGIGRNTLFAKLRDAGVITTGGRLPYQRYAHWFEIKTSYWTDYEGVEHASYTAYVKPDSVARVLDKGGVMDRAAVEAIMRGGRTPAVTA